MKFSTLILLFFCVNVFGIDDAETRFREVKLAAENGDKIKQCDLGEIFEKGTNGGVSIDKEAAVKWYRKSAEQGYAPAQFRLGRCYRNAISLIRDDVLAFKFYSLAAEQNYNEAIFSLGLCYDNGEGVKKDKIFAWAFYSLFLNNSNMSSTRTINGISFATSSEGNASSPSAPRSQIIKGTSISYAASAVTSNNPVSSGTIARGSSASSSAASTTAILSSNTTVISRSGASDRGTNAQIAIDRLKKISAELSQDDLKAAANRKAEIVSHIKKTIEKKSENIKPEAQRKAVIKSSDEDKVSSR